MVLKVDPPKTFSFRWTHDAGTEPTASNSLFVTFTPTASGSGTLLRFIETGFREMGWDEATFEASSWGRERRYRIDETQFARAVAQLQQVDASWDARLGRIKRLAEHIEQTKNK
ncbi:hypothetical protein AB0B25_03245 [Nocardia sp. NPDC049190]|uniref:hypothetical protein n=1 Tax=Nocardia sp. NPDC049190 TaxID=3155650 RepID=UPI0033C526F0